MCFVCSRKQILSKHPTSINKKRLKTKKSKGTSVIFLKEMTSNITEVRGI